MPDNLKNIVREKLPVVKLLIAGVEFENELQQEPEQAQPQLPQQAQPQAPQQPSWWQRWLPLFARRQWTASN